MKAIIFIVLFFLTKTNIKAVTVNDTSTFNIQGSISNHFRGFIYLNYVNENAHYIKDSFLICNTNFTFKGGVNKFYNNATLWLKHSVEKSTNFKYFNFKFGLENSNIKIYLDLYNSKKNRVEGDETAKKILKFETKIVKSVNKKLEKTNILKNPKEHQRLANNLKYLVSKTIKSNPNQNFSAYLLFDYKKLFSLKDLENNFQSLSNDQQNSYYGKYVTKGINENKLKYSQVGLSVINFKATTYFGDTISLYNYTKQGYVLLDFWASWCNPCRASHPSLKKLHEKYSKKGLTVIGVSCDEVKDEVEWRKAILNDSIWFWPHIMTTASNSKEKYQNLNLLEDYKVSFLPTQILLDSSNKIVARLQNEMELIEKLKEIYGE